MKSDSHPDALARTLPTAQTPSLEESLVVMDIADRLRRRQDRLAQASDVQARRDALRQRLRSLYARQGIDIDEATLEKAIEQSLDQRLTHTQPSGFSAMLARAYVRLVGSD